MADPEQKVEEEEAGMDATPDDFFDPNLYAGDSILGILNVPASPDRSAASPPRIADVQMKEDES